ncbi:hypothetical protein S101468_01393 [Acetobacter pasteurianus subsp. pasteurianus]|uniref:Membrane protease subunit n=1 Tax=Acetobacter pasteurianus subsp. pasteurianus TaxID=481145 RepID=A0AAC9SNI2_ACEPA|nr:hypothetical protein [Acetobacter pasteurianus]ASC05651.1 hypothetical protein S101468_01393 [Acetobacter pasteurianus subsp. pasteurianus]
MIKELKMGFGAGAAILIGISAWMAAYPSYRVYSAKMHGEAELAQATQNKQIIVQQAQAEKEAEVLKAQGTAEANKIIGNSLAGNEAYLRWLWVNKLDSGGNEKTVVYVPTDGMVPQLEMGRIGNGAVK